MRMKSLWTDQARLPEFPALEGELKTDVLVIGGGLTGLLCAHRLTGEGVDCALIEVERICSGVTANTTAKLTVQHSLSYHKLLDRFGEERSRLYLAANRAALEEYAALCAGIDCDFERKDAYVYATGGTKELEAEQRALEKLGAPVEWVEKLPIPVELQGALRWPNQAQFHPLKFAAAIAPGLRIFEHTKAVSFEGPGVVRTQQGRIEAKQIIVATHFPLLNKHGAYYLKLYQHRSYVLALEGAQDVEGMYVDASGEGLSFRNYKDFLLLGGGAHRTGKPGGGWEELRAFALEHYPGAREAYHWATQDCMSLDGAPYIGPYSPAAPGLWVATGFNKWGMTSAMVSAMILSELVQGRTSEFAPAFEPARPMAALPLLGNAWAATANLLTPTAPRCPHLGCALKWNPEERSWDCPCHGSRFGEDGTLLDGPATGDKKMTRRP